MLQSLGPDELGKQSRRRSVVFYGTHGKVLGKSANDKPPSGLSEVRARPHRNERGQKQTSQAPSSYDVQRPLSLGDGAYGYTGSQMPADVEAKIALAPHEKEMLKLKRGKPLSKDEMRRFEA